MTRRQLAYFVAVADHGSITSAAQALFVSQPALSQAIKAFEAELGVSLFRRKRGGGARLASAGDALIGPARQILRNFETAESLVANETGLRSGRLDIAALPALGADPLADLLGPFHARHPGIAVRIADPDAGDVLELLYSGDCEIGVTLAPVPRTTLDVMLLDTQPLFLALPPISGYDNGDVVPLAELENIGLVVSTATKNILMALLSDTGIRPHLITETAHPEAKLPLVIRGVGATLCTPGAARDATALGATVCRLDPSLLITVALVYREATLSPAARAFVAFLQANDAPAAAPPA